MLGFQRLDVWGLASCGVRNNTPEAVGIQPPLLSWRGPFSVIEQTDIKRQGARAIHVRSFLNRDIQKSSVCYALLIHCANGLDLVPVSWAGCSQADDPERIHES
jgi:hypothetical protein